ncbi:MAG: radical SAM protein, partial [Deltaproteobacteria bacterium]|nr:radical SAM protein [Deltaproteobacteria bacterium]
KLSEGLQANYITLTGSGEPTLNSRCGEIIRAIKQLTEIPIAVIHNGSLLWDPSVREDLAAADLVIPSLDAGDALTFEKVNRPQRSISYDKMLSGLIAFSKAFQGKIWLEVLLLGGSTASETEVAKIAAQVRKIRPNLVHLKIVARSSSMNFDYEFSETEMLNLMKMFGETTQIIAGFSGIRDKMEFSVRMEEVLGLLNQQSCTLEEVSIALGMHRREAAKYLNLLLRQGVITRKKTAEKFFYASLKR